MNFFLKNTGAVPYLYAEAGRALHSCTLPSG